jgi:alpha-D-ribose 1-methylphosphonate 5-triphosphate synthase subunit PhnL
MTLMVQAQGLTKGFTLHLRGGLHIPVFNGLNLELRAGECIALNGPSGSGKSTLMRVLYGTYRVDRGRILVRHRGALRDLATANERMVLEIRRETIGYVSQFLRVVPRVGARDLVSEAAIAHGITEEEARIRAEALLARLHIPRHLHALPPATFSGGEQQRVNLARGFVVRRPLLLLDEPTASLDGANRRVVIELIREAKQDGVAIVGIFHDREVREAVADRLFPMEPLQDAA